MKTITIPSGPEGDRAREFFRHADEVKAEFKAEMTARYEANKEDYDLIHEWMRKNNRCLRFKSFEEMKAFADELRNR